MQVSLNPTISKIRNISKTKKSPKLNTYKTSCKGYFDNVPPLSFKGLIPLKSRKNDLKNKEIKTKTEELKNNAQEIQSRAELIYRNFAIKNKYTDAIHMFCIGKSNNFMSVKNVLNNNVIYFDDTSDAKDSKKTIRFREYQDDKLIRQATMENGDISEVYEQKFGNYQKYNYINGKLSQYSYGTNYQGNYIEDESFTFNPKGKLSRYSKYTREVENGIFKEALRYEFDEHGKLSSYKKDIKKTASDEILKIGTQYCFKNGRLVSAKYNRYF